MEFREATDELLSRISHERLADTLGVSVAAVRQARLSLDANAHRPPPKGWQFAVIRLAEQQIMRNRELIENVRRDTQSS